MARQLDFGNDCHVAGLSVGNNFADFILTVVAAIPLAPTVITPCSYRGESGIAFDFQAPSLVFGEVQV